MSTFRFVDVLPDPPYQPIRSPNRRIRPEAQLLLDFAEELRQRPMTWGVWPRPLTATTAAATTKRVREGFYRGLNPGGGFECCYRDGVVYVRHNPERMTSDSDRWFRDGYAAGQKRALKDLGSVIERAFTSARAELSELKEGIGGDDV